MFERDIRGFLRRVCERLERQIAAPVRRLADPMTLWAGMAMSGASLCCGEAMSSDRVDGTFMFDVQHVPPDLTSEPEAVAELGPLPPHAVPLPDEAP